MTDRKDYEGVSDEEFFRRVPKKRIAAGIIARNEQGWLLLVKPTYKTTWEIPGGMVDPGESPSAACSREITEELGLSWPVGRLVAVAYEGNDVLFAEGLMLLFDGGIHIGVTAHVNPAASLELSEAEWCPVDLALDRVDSRLRRRLQEGLKIIDTAATAYLEEGKTIA